MLKSFKYKLNLNKKQREYFDKTFGCTRLIYNLALAAKIQYYQSTKQSLSAYDLINQLKDLKNGYPFLKEVSNMTLQQSILNMDKAYQNFYKGFGFPKFKNKHSSQSCKYNQAIDVNLKEHKILIPKIGWINFYRDKPFNGELKSITISKNTLGYYFTSILVDTEIPKLEQINAEIGIDLGLKHFMVDSNGYKIDNPRYFISAQKNLKKHQRRLSRKVKGSNRYNKQKLKVAKCHYKISNQRKDFLHKLSSKLINENQVICLEDLNVSDMIKNHNLSKSISDAGWSEFVRQLKYKALWYGREIKQIDRFYPSSKTCNSCELVNQELKLEDREWICECGVKHDRDINAAKNILKIGTGNASKNVELLPIGKTVKRSIKLKMV